MISPSETLTETDNSSRDYAALAARIRRRYAVCTTRVRVGGVEIPFTRVADPDVVFDEMAAASNPSERDDASLQPYWAKAWDSNLGIAEALSSIDLVGSRVLDLGCGLGLIGAVAAARGAEVWLADAATPSLLFARQNTWPWRERCHARRFDWRRDRIRGVVFDWIIGSDILYDRAEWPYLESLWSDQLAGGGVVVLGEPFRLVGDEFARWMADKPWQLTTETREPDESASRLRLFWLKRIDTSFGPER